MTLRFSAAVDAADWLTGAAAGNPVVPVPPSTFAAYARVRYIPDPTGPGQAESSVEVPEHHPADLEQARRALEVLAGFTATPERLLWCVWDGWGALPPRVAAGPRVELPYRSHALVTGGVADLAAWEGFPGTAGMPPALVWPADHAWLFESDVDPHWAGVGCSAAARDALLAEARLDVVTADPDTAPPAYRG